MDHDDVLEQLELAALERGGIDRLMAGDTVAAAAVAGHIAGCDRCAGELERLRRAEPLLRDLVRTTPPADLRERTLAFVREHGVARGAGTTGETDAAAVVGTAGVGVMVADTVGAAGLPAAGAPAVGAAPSATGAIAGHGSVRRVVPWAAAIAAAVLISVAATTVLIDSRVQDQLTAQSETIDQLGRVTMATLDVTAEPDAERVALAATEAGSMTSGTLVFSPSTTELVVVATGLTEPPTGQEYRCWVALADGRVSIGKMFFGGGLAYWAGDVASVASLPSDATFGVSITEVGGSSLEADPVIAGEL